jgi:hypothetical protein
MTIRTAKLSLIYLFALPLLTSCGLFARKPTLVITRPEVIEVSVPAYRPLPTALTDPLLPPPAPPARCHLGGAPAVCALDGLAQITMWEALLDLANKDRAKAALAGKTDGQ